MSTGYRIGDQQKLHYLTLTVIGWIDVFTRQVYRDIIIDSLKYCQQHKGLELYAYVIMSNHVHLIAKTKEGYDLSDFLRDFKKHTSKEIIKTIEEGKESRKEWMLSIFASSGAYNRNNKNYQFWQQDNHPIELFSNEIIMQKLKYIHNNPVRAGWVEHPEEYLYSSARNYSELESKIEVELLMSKVK